uniref:Putative secreted protein n=1 Tax=Anopheles darlingi TaxID=43151 RepID=A0A2M4D2A1_ANODA
MLSAFDYCFLLFGLLHHLLLLLLLFSACLRCFHDDADTCDLLLARGCTVTRDRITSRFNATVTPGRKWFGRQDDRRCVMLYVIVSGSCGW